MYVAKQLCNRISRMWAFTSRSKIIIELLLRCFEISDSIARRTELRLTTIAIYLKTFFFYL